MSLNQDIEQWLVSEQTHFHGSPFNTPRPRPHVTLSYAQSCDGSITTAPGRTLALSSDSSLKMTHQLRSLHDGILVGIGTVIADDPRLTVREWSGSDPQPIVLDSQLRMPPASRLCQSDEQRCWVLTTQRGDATRPGCELIVLPGDDAGHIDLHEAMDVVYRRGIHSLMIEGGASVISAFLRERLADAVVLTLAPLFVGGDNAVGQLGNLDAADFPSIAPLHSRQVGNELIIWGSLRYGGTKPTGSTS
ncbi:MAG: RibD family protein [Chromatocurvus sp.]